MYDLKYMAPIWNKYNDVSMLRTHSLWSPRFRLNDVIRCDLAITGLGDNKVYFDRVFRFLQLLFHSPVESFNTDCNFIGSQKSSAFTIAVSATDTHNLCWTKFYSLTILAKIEPHQHFVANVVTKSGCLWCGCICVFIRSGCVGKFCLFLHRHPSMRWF